VKEYVFIGSVIFVCFLDQLNDGQPIHFKWSSGFCFLNIVDLIDLEKKAGNIV